MGKKLIIKGADFSVNGIHESIVRYATDETGTTETGTYWSVTAKRVGYFNADAQIAIKGHPINYIKIGVKPFGDTTLLSDCCLWKYDTNTGTATIVTRFEITSEDLSVGYKVIQFPQMTLSNTEELYVGIPEPSVDNISCKYPLLVKYNHELTDAEKMSVLVNNAGDYSTSVPITTEGSGDSLTITYCRVKIEVGLL